MATSEIKDPYINFNFHVEIDGITRAAFQQCSGFDSTIDITEYREGGDNTTPRKLPSMTKYSNIQLKRGMTDDTELYDWHRQAILGDIVRKNGSIVLYDRKQAEVARWNFVRAWPSKYDGPDLNAEGRDVAIEMLELAHEGLERVKV
jgi:phage tail-like protein